MKNELNDKIAKYITDETKRSMHVSDDQPQISDPQPTDNGDTSKPEFEIIAPSPEQATKQTALVKKEPVQTEIQPSVRSYSLIETGDPVEVVARKHDIAKVLQDIVNKRKTGLVIAGKRLLVYEEWLMIAKMYSCFPRIVSTTYGLEKYSEICFEAVAELVHMPTSSVIGRAEAMASKMENGKQGFDINKIRSLAQTRACGKVIRLVFSDVVVLAGYCPTPLDEIEDMAQVEQTDANKIETGGIKGLRIS